eukprot:GHVO01038900.1.p1 GENE.GHVO01038900.1~~GHVO01038900.1.p1  ORF type:complete len:203 (+),score=17.41 GHVO01038900.1:413-1021(+)
MWRMEMEDVCAVVEAEAKRLRTEVTASSSPNQPSKYLTEHDEKTMTMNDLDRFWKLEALNRYNEDLGTMTQEQKELPRHEVRRLLATRKHEKWVESMKNKGIQLRQCPNCHELVRRSHRCFATNWRTGGKGAKQKEIVVEKTAEGVTVKQKPKIDEAILQKQFEQIMKLKKEVRTDRIRRIIGEDFPMTEEATTAPEHNSRL